MSKIIDTSKAAYEAAKPELIPNHHQKILEALAEMEAGTYEEVAIKCGFTNPNQASRRISELITLGKVYRTELKKPTTTGRNAYLIAIAGTGLPKAEDKPKKVRQNKPQPQIQPAAKDTIPVVAHVRRKNAIKVEDVQNKLF